MTAVRSERLARLRPAGLYLVTDDRLEPAAMLERLGKALRAGARVVQFRDKTVERRELLRRAELVQRLCRSHDALCIVNDAVDVAMALAADGVHLGQEDLPPTIARRLVGPDMLIGLSISHLPEAQAAAAEATVDYLGVGAVFPTGTKADAEFGGLDLLRAVRTTVRLPLVAIGGITIENAPRVWAAGADLLAVVSAVFLAPDAGLATRGFLDSQPGPRA